jgi:uncharacterized protein (DUF433 family)
MTLNIQYDPVPLYAEANHLRVGKTQILLDAVVAAYKLGATAEEIVWQFPSLVLADVYAVISYYLRHETEIEAYLTRRPLGSTEMNREIDSEQPSSNGHVHRSEHPMMALANLGECADMTVSMRAKEILSHEINQTHGWSVVDDGNR